MEGNVDDVAKRLRTAVANAFPAIDFQTLVTPGEDDPDGVEGVEDSLDLRKNLQGRAWTQIPDGVVDRQCGGLVLLTPEAFAAFLPAWLTKSLDYLKSENEVREYTVYAFCRFRNNEQPELTALLDERYLQRLRQLTPAQVTVVRDFLSLIKTHEPCSDLRQAAADAIAEIAMIGLDKGPGLP